MSQLFNVKGLDELQKFLDQLPAKMEANVMRGALRAGIKPVGQEAKRLLAENGSQQTGELAAGLNVSTKRSGGQIVARLRALGDHGYVARWVEYGTAAHLVSIDDRDRPMRKTRRGLKAYSLKTINKMIQRGSLVVNGRFVGPYVEHPGARPKPFMRPALDNRAQDAVVAAAEYIKRRLATKHGLDTSGVEIEVEP